MIEPEPFALPEEPSAAAAIAAIAEELSVFDGWEDRYRYIIDLGHRLPAFPPAWMDEARRVAGCQSKVWLASNLRLGRLYLAGASDAAIVAGLVALMLRVYSGREPREIAATDPAFLTELGLIGALSMSRGNGIAAMARKIRAMAEEAERRAPATT